MHRTLPLLVLSLSTASLVACDAVVPEPHDTPTERAHEPLDLDDWDDNELAFLKARGSLNPDEDVVFWWTGSIYLVQDADPFGPPVTDFPGPILRFEGFNIARFEPVADGTRMVSREMALYQDVAGNRVDCWWNGNLGIDSPAPVPVVHVWNDPVNHTIGGANYDELGDQIAFNTEIDLNYPSPLPLDSYPEYSQSNTYSGTELFNWYADRADLEDPTLDSVPVAISWTRVGQLLPWMQAGQTEGKLVYHTRGRKLMGGFEDLPDHLKDLVLAEAPEYQTAPDVDLSPNATSWRVFRSLVDSGEYSPSCG